MIYAYIEKVKNGTYDIRKSYSIHKKNLQDIKFSISNQSDVEITDNRKNIEMLTTHLIENFYQKVDVNIPFLL